MDKWDRRHLGMAKQVATWSKDVSTRVGSRVVDPRNRVIAEGFNGPPRGVTDDPSISREQKLRRTIHAEKNVLLFAQRDLTGCTMYVTHHPCSQCAALIAQSGIARVVVPTPDTPFAERWAEDIAEAKRIFEESGVQLNIVEVE